MSAPALRFKDDDGRDFPEWEELALGSVATLYNGRAYKQTEWERVGTPVIRLQNLTGSSSNYYYSNIQLPEKQYCDKGDLLYMWSATFGPVWWQGERAIYHYHIWKIETNDLKLSKNFLYFVLDDITAKMKSTSNGSTMAHITKGGIEKLGFQLPAITEQTKIASFLTAVDEKISQITRKHDLLTQYKKGVMQQIFSQELRFKDDNGCDFPEWEEKRIGEIADRVTAGATPSTLNKKFWGGSIRWMNSGELNLKRVFEVENRITEFGLNNSSTKLIPPKCVLIGLAGQGKTRGTVAMNMVELCTNQSIAAIHPKPAIFNEEFLFQNLEMRYDELRSLSTGDGGRGGLNLQIIKSMEIVLPVLAEQTKIANFLTAMDEKITATKTQLETVKQYKQGLLQQMFV